MKLFTDALTSDGFFDARYTCDLDNSSPEIRWSEPPPLTASFALIMGQRGQTSRGDFPFCHWVVFNIPANLRHLPAGIPPQEILPNGIRQGNNSFGKLGYTGPCPRPGSGSQSFVFQLFALLTSIEVPGRPSREELTRELQPFLLEVAQVTGRYERRIFKAG
ncbi:YbhB/YbcL family Raf kinase inhibitor-like protein [Bdellovibrionota bacterium FG-2]